MTLASSHPGASFAQWLAEHYGWPHATTVMAFFLTLVILHWIDKKHPKKRK